MNRGYIKFWRKAQDSSSWNRGLMYQGLIINLLSRAAWKKGSYQGRELVPGQFGTVLGAFAKELDVPRSTLQRMLAHLEADSFLKIENVGNRFVVISIINWHSYQASEKEGGQQLPGGQPMVNHASENRATERATGEQTNAHSQLENTSIDDAHVGNRLVNHWATVGCPRGQPSYKEEEVKKEEEEEEYSTASASRAAERIQPGEPSPPPSEKPEPFYLTRKKRRLAGKRLETFGQFWAVFAFPKGKADAADAWLDIPELTNSLVEKIIAAAEREAAARPGIVASGLTPKWAQGWLSGRRWEDEVLPGLPTVVPGASPPPTVHTQYQKGRRDQEGLAALALRARKELANNGNGNDHLRENQYDGNGVSAPHECGGVGGNPAGMDRHLAGPL